MQACSSYKCCPKSEGVYRKYYDQMMKIKESEGCATVDEALRYTFEIWSSSFAASTLSTRLSGIKSILIADGITFSDNTIKYIQKCICNKAKAGPPSKQAAAFSLQDITSFLKLSHKNDASMLLKKVILLTGVFCLLRGQELRMLQRRDIRVLYWLVL